MGGARLVDVRRDRRGRAGAFGRRRRAVVSSALIAVALTACGPLAPGPGGDPVTPEATTSQAEPPSTTAEAPPPVGDVGTPVDVVTGLDAPWGVALLPGGDALVTLRDEARVVRLAADGTMTRLDAGGPDGTVPGVAPRSEAGLLGIAVAPDDPTDVFLYLTATDENRVVRARLDGDALTDLTTIVDGIPADSTHNGGRLAFGPDGFLYVTTGDAQIRPNAQDLDSLGGKILRVTHDGAAAPGNPFDTRVWSYGHRNVQGIGWTDGGVMYASEFGQNALDEVNRIEPGGNYGWPEVEGGGGTDRGFVDPVVTWPTSDASPSGLAVTAHGVWVAALRGERLWFLPFTGADDDGVGPPRELLTSELGRLRHVLAVDPDTLWLVTNNTDGRGDPRAGDDRIAAVDLGP
ncbi:glucose sorbosone dehydrogenase [Beutenbergia cavernae DSM 12333]|uniref:Glucose sorbosone dehydrogenase n=1 Tax=Beutenbergia cavernae (strain ATCC BAA-8 / DSM 12333 / CCUG 43141 / JCM 11478 / NBRC 16432 / NCIMB 13614 / HKI 0122) TaxID=471853 RepID=C5C040_BEUC1|nr:PQQ-dependent sugar dehydrogenase [Beutenbergia cavernae]ACQ79226.1 glucose sorbosone dehydrogenase [Beutenbergia cavernae DSM 12333]